MDLDEYVDMGPGNATPPPLGLGAPEAVGPLPVPVMLLLSPDVPSITCPLGLGAVLVIPFGLPGIAGVDPRLKLALGLAFARAVDDALLLVVP